MPTAAACAPAARTPLCSGWMRLTLAVQTRGVLTVCPCVPSVFYTVSCACNSLLTPRRHRALRPACGGLFVVDPACLGLAVSAAPGSAPREAPGRDARTSAALPRSVSCSTCASRSFVRCVGLGRAAAKHARTLAMRSACHACHARICRGPRWAPLAHQRGGHDGGGHGRPRPRRVPLGEAARPVLLLRWARPARSDAVARRALVRPVHRVGPAEQLLPHVALGMPRMRDAAVRADAARERRVGGAAASASPSFVHPSNARAGTATRRRR
jgi:hypothetical protein